MNRLQVVAFVLAAGLNYGARAAAQSPSAQSAPAPQKEGAPPATAPASRASSGPAGNAEEGKKLYASYGCYQCHGYEAQGSSATGPRLGPRPIAFAAFSRYVRQPTGQMPLYTSKVVSDTDLANIYAFVQARPTPPPVQTIPLLK